MCVPSMHDAGGTTGMPRRVEHQQIGIAGHSHIGLSGHRRLAGRASRRNRNLKNTIALVRK